MPQDLFLPLGVQAETGELLPTIESDTLADFSSLPVEAHLADLPKSMAENWQDAPPFGTDCDVRDMNNLAETGWAILFSNETSDNVKRMLQPLIELRQRQVGNDALFKIFDGGESFQKGDTAETWLSRRSADGIPMADVDPAKGVPFYLLIVGSPEEIPFEFQYGLDLFWAVGRLWFPTAAEYGQYAEAVVRYENAGTRVETARQMAIFAPRNGQDKAMELLTENLAVPMTRPSNTKPPFGEKQNFRLRKYFGEAATVESLDQIWRGKIPHGRPALVFTGSHGMVFYSGDRRQANQQGAIVCNEWPGVGAPKSKQYFAADDVAKDARLDGMIHFLFNCYGAGSPRKDNFAGLSQRPSLVAEQPFLGRLPQVLLKQGALAVLGHVDRAWSSSYRSALGPRIEGFRGVVSQLLMGDRIGYATDRLNRQWSTLSIDIVQAVEARLEGDELKSKWIARNNARNYIVVGDPAVRLRVADMGVLAD